MDSVYIPEIRQLRPGVLEGSVEFTRNSKTFDVNLSILTIHPTSDEALSQFEGHSATVFLHRKTDIRKFAQLSPWERDDFRQKSHEYAGICASLAMMPWPNTDVVLTVDHAGELIGRYVGILRELPAGEVRREKEIGPDGTERVVRVMLPPNIDIKGKNVFLLDEFIGTGYTLRIIIDAIHQAGGRVNGIGVIATLGDSVPRLEEMPYRMIPITTLVRLKAET